MRQLVFLIAFLCFSGFAFTNPILELELKEALKLDRYDSVMYYYPDFLKKHGEEEYKEQVFEVMRGNPSEYELFRCLCALTLVDCNYWRIPIPSGIMDIDWHQTLRNKIKIDLEKGYDSYNSYEISRVLQKMVVFYTSEELSESLDTKRVLQIAGYTKRRRWQKHEPRYSLGRSRLAIKKWVQAYWDIADEVEREKVVNDLFLNPVLKVNQDTPVHEEVFPLYQWFKDHPEKLSEALTSSDRRVRQETLRVCIVENPPLLPYSDEIVIEALLDGLVYDWTYWNHRVCSELLVKYKDKTLPAMRKKFQTSKDSQQKTLLCDLLIYLNDKESQKYLFEYLYGLLEATERKTIDHPWYPIRSWLSRHRWAAIRLIWLEDLTSEILLEKFSQNKDPFRASLLTHVFVHKGYQEQIPWSVDFVNLLAKGLKDNQVRYDLGLCASALKYCPDEYKEGLFDIAFSTSDEQQRLAISIIMEYLNKDFVFYQLLFKDAFNSYKNFYRKYWEYDYSFLDKKKWKRGESEFQQTFQSLIEASELRSN